MTKTRTANEVWILMDIFEMNGYILVIAPENIKSKHKHEKKYILKGQSKRLQF